MFIALKYIQKTTDNLAPFTQWVYFYIYFNENGYKYLKKSSHFTKILTGMYGPFLAIPDPGRVAIMRSKSLGPSIAK